MMHWNWLKIGLWDPQTPYSNAVYLVSLDPVSPYPQNRLKLPMIPPRQTTCSQGERNFGEGRQSGLLTRARVAHVLIGIA